MGFRILLGLIGALLTIASRFNRTIQRQVWLARVIEIGSDDGVVYHYVFERRRIRFRRGPAEHPTCAIRFASSQYGLRVLIAADRFGLIVEGLGRGLVEVGGDAPQFLWFEGLLRAALPVPGTRPAPVMLPSRYVRPPQQMAEDDGYITREPEAHELDPDWTGAVAQRRTLMIIRVPAGESFGQIA